MPNKHWGRLLLSVIATVAVVLLALEQTVRTYWTVRSRTLSYLEPGLLAWNGQPGYLLEGHGPPLFPLLLGAGVKLGAWFGFNEITSLKVVNLLTFLMALAALLLLLSRCRAALRLDGPSARRMEMLLTLLGLGVFGFFSLSWITLWDVNPGFLALAALLTAAAAATRLLQPLPKQSHFAWLGAMLGFTALVQPPLVLVELLIAGVIGLELLRRKRLSGAHARAAALALVAVAGPWVAAVSLSHGGRMPMLGRGKLVHAAESTDAARLPAPVVVFEETAPVTYLPILQTDMVQPRGSAWQRLGSNVGGNMHWYRLALLGPSLRWLTLFTLLGLAAFVVRGSIVGGHLLVPALFALVALMLMEVSRPAAAPFLILAVLGAAMAIPVSSNRVYRLTMASAALALLSAFVPLFREAAKPSTRDLPLATETLRQLGVRAGDRIGMIGGEPWLAWTARGVGARIVAEVSAEQLQPLLKASPGEFEAAVRSFEKAGAVALVTSTPEVARDRAGLHWVRVENLLADKGHGIWFARLGQFAVRQ